MRRCVFYDDLIYEHKNAQNLICKRRGDLSSIDVKESPVNSCHFNHREYITKLGEAERSKDSVNETDTRS